jgi:ATP-binding protein involved in chromosome partitioning
MRREAGESITGEYQIWGVEVLVGWVGRLKLMQEIPGIHNIVAVGSGKGGVGKTTMSVNLAIALSRLGNRVGLLDADVYGPNVPLMMGVSEAPLTDGQKIKPIIKEGLRVMSMGFLNPGDKPLVWRGPMLHNVMQQFLRQVEWGELDYLIIDLPPGTGDVQLSLMQTTKLNGAVVVTTPSDVSLEDARKAVNMFHQVKVPVLGLVENMSYLIAPQSKERIDVFGHGAGKKTAEVMGIHFLGELALIPDIRKGGDSGRPVALEGPASENAAGFYEVARRVEERTKEVNTVAGPTMSVSD